jgi:hypothetical protein
MSLALAHETATVERCANCAAERAGAYCHSCGQRFLEERLTTSVLAREITERFTFERGLLRTVRDMSLRPGSTIKRYVSGHRGGYVSPLTYVLFGAAAALLARSMYREQLSAWIRQQGAGIAETPLLSSGQAAAFSEVMVSLTQQTSFVGLALCLPVAAAVRVLFRRSGINFAEAAVFALFVCGQALLVQAVFVTPLHLLAPRPGAFTLSAIVPFTVVGAIAAPGYFGRPVRSAVKAAVAVLCSYALFAFTVSGATLAYVLLLR